MPAIQIEHLSMHFGGTAPVVEDFNLSVKKNEFVSIVGPSGCGKTTVLNLLTGLLPMEQGSISILGKPPVAGNPEVAYMLARDCMLPWRTTLGNATYGAEIRRQDKAAREERARHLLERVGLSSFEDKYPKALSHGMRQRCALARTFCLNSPVLLMDEPFGALDAQTKLQLEDLLLELCAIEQHTVVFITHDLAEAVALSDRVIVMSSRPGRIVADIEIPLPRPRSVRQLQKDPIFHELYTRVWTELEAGLAPREQAKTGLTSQGESR